MAYYEDFDSDYYSSSSSNSSNKSIPSSFIINFMVKLLNLSSLSNICFDRITTSTGHFKVKADIDVLNIVVQKLQLFLWENRKFETVVSCEKNKIISMHVGDTTKAKSRIAYKKIQMKDLISKRRSVLSEIQSIMSKYNILPSELDMEIRKTVKVL
jgi:hypothetical protein